MNAETSRYKIRRETGFLYNLQVSSYHILTDYKEENSNFPVKKTSIYHLNAILGQIYYSVRRGTKEDTHHFLVFFAKNIQPASNHDETSHKPKLRDTAK